MRQTLWMDAEIIPYGVDLEIFKPRDQAGARRELDLPADVMVMASDREGSPSAIRETMGCNLPIVSMDVGDVASVIQGTEGCYLAERSPEDLATY